nr:hypothetical protein GCM10017745_49380 [Saccharothrix mutabilis subsp. capreolus]
MTNAGQTTITGATVTDDLTDVLDDATFDTASASTGTSQLAPPLLTWTGDLPIGASATITYTVTVNNPVTGDGSLDNAVTNTTPGHNPEPPVRTTTPITALDIDKTVDKPAAAAGDLVTYTLTLTNTGQTTITGAQVTDDLTDVLDDATFGTVTASTGSATISGTALTWTGDLAVGGTATITYTVTVNNPLTGNHVLGNAVTNTTPGFPPQPPVLTTTPVAALDITKQVDKPTAVAGDTVTYTITVTNRGQTTITGATITDDLTGVLDDAAFGTVTATIGTPLFAAPTLTWTGDLASGDSAVITYTVTVNDTLTGDGLLANSVTDTTPGHNPTPPIRTATPVGVIRLDKAVDRGSTTVGGTVSYTLTVTNTGQGPVTGARVDDDLTDVLDDADLDTFTTTAGSVTFLSPTLTWTGDLAAGASATVTYTVTVSDPISGDGILRNSAANTTPGMGTQPRSTPSRPSRTSTWRRRWTRAKSAPAAPSPTPSPSPTPARSASPHPPIRRTSPTTSPTSSTTPGSTPPQPTGAARPSRARPSCGPATCPSAPPPPSPTPSPSTTRSPTATLCSTTASPTPPRDCPTRLWKPRPRCPLWTSRSPLTSNGPSKATWSPTRWL